MTSTIARAHYRITILLTILLACIGTVYVPSTRAQIAPPPTPAGSFTVYLPFVRAAERTTSPVPGAPTITTFTSSAATVAPGGEATLSWTVSSVTSVRIEPGIGPVTGSSVTVKPATTTTYTLIATNGAQEARATITVTVTNEGGGSHSAFVEHERQTSSPAIAIDAVGVSHLAYRAARPNTQIYDLIYAICPAPASRCGGPERWQRVTLPLAQVDQVQLQLTHDGHPRIVARAYYADNFHYRVYQYVACDTNCLIADAWTSTEAAYTQPDAEAELYSYLLPAHFFVLDAQDRPRFAFANRYAFSTTEPTRQYQQGGYFAQCDADCANVGSWTATPFTSMRPDDVEGFEYYDWIVYPSLALTRDGAPRIVAHLNYAAYTDEPLGLYYFGCDTGCDSSDSWMRTKIADRGNGPHPAWKLALDGDDRPRVAYYEEPDVTTLSTHRLFFLQCDSDCAQGGPWNTLDLGLPAGTGDGVDLVLDAQGRPRMAFVDTDDALQYVWCNAGCDTAGGWQQTTVETRDKLAAELSPPIAPNCDGGLWNTQAVMLTLDAAGDPHVAHRSIFQERCYTENPVPGQPPSFSFEDIWHAARVATFPQP